MLIYTDNYSRNYGQENPEFVIKYDNFVNNENASVLTKIPTISCDANINTYSGEYLINISDADATNYNIIYNESPAILIVLALAPEVKLLEVKDITFNSASVKSNLISDGGDYATEKGICWSINQNPTINDNTAQIESETAEFNYVINNLLPKTLYYLRAYANNSADIVYSNEMYFYTTETNIVDLDNIILLYPNPAKDYVKLINVENTTIEIYNIIGSLIATYSNVTDSEITINLDKIQVGTYFIKITDDKNVITKKLVKK